MVEAPFLRFHKDRFYLFYSANDYYNSRYAIGYATSAELAGPYIKPGGPWQDSSDTGNGNVSPSRQHMAQVTGCRPAQQARCQTCWQSRGAAACSA